MSKDKFDPRAEEKAKEKDLEEQEAELEAIFNPPKKASARKRAT